MAVSAVQGYKPDMIYLDFAATTPMAPTVLEKMKFVMAEDYGNPSSPHGMGLRAEKIVERTRRELLQVMGLEKTHQCVFTSGGSEGNSQVLQTLLTEGKQGGNIVLSAVEHNSIRSFLPRLRQAGIQVREVLPRKDGELKTADVLDCMDPETRLVSIMAVNNESGLQFNVNVIANTLKKKFPRVRIHSDFVQGFMKIPMDLRKLDLITIAAHKIYGPKGVGAVVVRTGQVLSALIVGSQERGLRGGTQNVPGIAGFGEAIRLLNGKIEDNLIKVRELREVFWKELSKNLPNARMAGGAGNSPYILGITVPGIKSEVLVRMLSEKGIFISAGSACSSRSRFRNNTATVLGLNPDEYLRISFSHTLSERDVVSAAAIISATCTEFRLMTGKR